MAKIIRNVAFCFRCSGQGIQSGPFTDLQPFKMEETAFLNTWRVK